MNQRRRRTCAAAQVLPRSTRRARDRPGAQRARRSRCSTLLEAGATRARSRLDRDIDGKIDDPGAAIMDAAWPKIADAVMGPVLGPQLDDLARA